MILKGNQLKFSGRVDGGHQGNADACDLAERACEDDGAKQHRHHDHADGAHRGHARARVPVFRECEYVRGAQSDVAKDPAPSMLRQ